MTLRVAIAGGGIGGVAAALFLRQAGIEAAVYEQAQQLRETGAGLVVPPNMVRLIDRLGLLPGLERVAVRLEAAWEFRRWQDGRVLSVQPMGALCTELYGAHCYVAHRAELLELLQQALPEGVLQIDRRCTAHRETADGVALTLQPREGEPLTVHADALIGADGIHSVVRPAIAPGAEARFSGLCAFRCLVPAVQAPAQALRPVQTLWLGPGRHLVHYPISCGRLVNIVAIVPAGDWRTESWTATGRVADMHQAFEGWDPQVQQLLAAATDTRRWALYDRSPLPAWTAGRVTLLGDAAHAMLPFFAQGAAQALEDAAVLAACLRGHGAAEVPQALRRYESLRLARASQVQRMSRGREVRNHLPDGAEQHQRDQELAHGEPLRQSAWLYGHDALHSFHPDPAGGTLNAG
jgi:salicylate hydroxylase